MSSENVAENTDKAIIVEGLRKQYGKIEALKGVNVQVDRGQIYGLLGANGAGKSTLIKILVGSSRPNAGTVQVLGLDPFKQAAALRRQIGYMPQSPALYEDLSARDNITFFGAAHHMPNFKGRVDEVLEFTALSSRQNDSVYGFSGGMKQRVSLACALIHQPQALLLDEPTAGVDPQLKEIFWQHFRELAAQGVTIFISTHLMDEALFCDRLAIMRDGAVLVEDTPKNILRRGHTVVKIWRGDQLDEQVITNYPTELPGVLQKYHFDPTVTRLELEEDTLEKIMLRLISAKENSPEQTAVQEVQHV